MRDIDVISTLTKKVTIDQERDTLHVYVAVPAACITLELSLEEADAMATGFARLVEERRREIAPRNLEHVDDGDDEPRTLDAAGVIGGAR